MASRLSSNALLLDGVSKTITVWIPQGYGGPAPGILFRNPATKLPVDVSGYRFKPLQVDLFSGVVNPQGVTANLRPLVAPIGELHLVPSSVMGRVDLLVPTDFYPTPIPPNSQTNPIAIAVIAVELPSGITQIIRVQIVLVYGRHS